MRSNEARAEPVITATSRSAADRDVGAAVPDRRLSLRMGLVLLVLAALVPMLIFAGWVVIRMAQAQTEITERNTQHLAQALAVAIDRELISMASALQVLTTSSYLADNNYAAFHRQASEALSHELIQREGVHIILAQANGQQLVNTRLPYGTPLPLSATPITQQVVETNRPQVSGLFSGPLTGRPLIGVSVPILEGGRVARVLSMIVPTEIFTNLLADQNLPQDWMAGLWDRQGIFITRFPRPEAFIGTRVNPYVAQMVADRPSGSFRFPARDGSALFSAFARSSQSGWVAAVAVRQTTLSRPMHQSLALVLAGGGVLLGLGVLMALTVGRRIAGPVAMLADSAAALAAPSAQTPSRAINQMARQGEDIWIRELRAVHDALQDAGRRLRDSRALERVAIEAAGIGFWSFDGRTGRIRTRGRIGGLLGLPDEGDAVPLEFWLRRVASDHRDGVLTALLPATPTSNEFDLELPVAAADGQVHWIAMRGSLMVEGGHGRAIGILEEVTERRRAHEEQLGELADRHATDRRLFAAIIESTSDFVVALDQEERFILFNGAYQHRFETLFGRKPIIGQTITEAMGHMPELLARRRAMWRRALNGEHFVLQEEIETRHQQRLRLEMAFEPIVDAAGRRLGAFLLARDVTERERTEAALRQAEETLRQAQKMEAIGKLTGGIAHDFNNLLQAVGTALHLIEQRAGDGPVKTPLKLATQAVQRGAALTQHLLTFSRRQRLEPKSVRVDTLVQGMGDLLERTLGGTIAIRMEMQPDLWPALVDPNQLEMAILNLAINARDAMPDGGTLTIRTGNLPHDASDRPADLPPGDFVRIAVIDDGVGMSQDVAARAFEPFFTTKGVGRGTGLGLSTVHGLTAQSGGTTTLDTAPGAGTTISLHLPRAPAEMETATPSLNSASPGNAMLAAPAEAPSCRPTSILLVEDETLVRLATSTTLTQAGFRVIEAAGGAEALEILAREPNLDVMVTDYAMPGMTGLELARALRAKRPDIPVLMVTGYAEMPKGSPMVNGTEILQKPYQADALVRRIRSITAPPAPSSPASPPTKTHH